MNIFITIAAVNGFLAVTLGAFGSHGLKGKISEHMLGIWQTGVQYHFFHVMALMVVGLLLQRGMSNTWLQTSGWAFSIGMVFFCASLYGLALGGPKWLGPITPLGGLCFMIGWLCLAVSSVQKT